ncbi:hypothetical protein LTR73_000025 [Friedmanniomyces endolithicus]|nr:hypothetical protein LTR73_000025 [Friedmanniomyces endolithicus]
MPTKPSSCRRPQRHGLIGSTLSFFFRKNHESNLDASAAGPPLDALYACQLFALRRRQSCTGTRNTRRFEYTEIDVMVAGYDKWKALYEFDTPVVHVDQAKELYKGTSQGEGTTAQAKKLMHRFTEAQLKATMDEVEHNTAS